ncbi:MAG: adenylate/guanylate cyclase domain-containing protein [Brevinematia bacterium]
MAERKSNKILNITIISLFFTALLFVFYYLPLKYDIVGLGGVLRKIESMSLSIKFNLTAQSKSDIVAGTLKSKVSTGVYKQIFLVLLDNPSVEKYGSMKIGYDRWAEVLNYLNNLENKPKIVWFDILFRDPGDTKKLKEELKKNNLIGQSVFLEGFENPEKVAKNILDYDSEIAKILKPFELTLNNGFDLSTYQIINSSITDIMADFGLIGAGNIEKENDVYLKLPLILRVQYYVKSKEDIRITNIFYPSSSLLAAVKFLDSDISNIVVTKNGVVIKDATYNNIRTDFVIPTDKNLKICINYRGRSKSGFLRSISLKDATRVGLPRNSIVIFGIDIEGLTENQWFSPVGNLTSTEHLAYSIGTILNRDFIYEVPDFINIIYVILLVLLIALFSGRRVDFIVIAAIAAVIIPLVFGFGLFFLRINLITFIPLVAGAITLIFDQIYLLITEEKEKRLIRATFSKYVSPEFVNILIQNPELARTGGEKREVTMLFSDIRSFTTLSEGMSARELVDFLNNYLSRMTDIILQNKGTLDKYIGDAIVAFWGMPVEVEDHAYYGCLSAVRMIKALSEFNREMELQGKTKINIGVGLNTGRVIVGNIGSEKKMNYTAIGDTATIAEELQDENKTYGTNIIISEFTYEKVKNFAKVRELGEYPVKNREKPIKIYELLDIVEK